MDGIDAMDTHFVGLSSEPFSKEVQAILSAGTNPIDVECKPDGILYLPEIKYRRLLLKAFGAGGKIIFQFTKIIGWGFIF